MNCKNISEFSKYLITGVVWTILNVLFMWLAIDIIKMPTLIGSTIVVGTVFVGKFYTYVWVKLMDTGFLNFSKYASVDLASIFLNIVLVWIFIDFMKIPTIISSSVVVAGLFVGRFIIFRIIGLIK